MTLGALELVDRQRYPIDAVGSPGFAAVVDHARAQLAATGAAERSGLWTPRA